MACQAGGSCIIILPEVLFLEVAQTVLRHGAEDSSLHPTLGKPNVHNRSDWEEEMLLNAGSWPDKDEMRRHHTKGGFKRCKRRGRDPNRDLRRGAGDHRKMGQRWEVGMAHGEGAQERAELRGGCNACSMEGGQRSVRGIG